MTTSILSGQEFSEKTLNKNIVWITDHKNSWVNEFNKCNHNLVYNLIYNKLLICLDISQIVIIIEVIEQNNLNTNTYI